MDSASSPNKVHTVVTIGRQFGSGGRVLAKMVADRLGYEFYDKKLLLEAARGSGMICLLC
ncbi:MAG: cytidylate kinase-like family protein, partial [Muribaculaceae bacterium]|nr:cytidylate kinase-like family protein [Muribaculaceae bacterium]